jgi:glutamyl-tRNA reductase
VNRTVATAQEFARSLDDPRVTAGPLSDIAANLATVDLAICAAESPDILIRADDIPVGRPPLCLIDVAMPRVIDLTVDEITGVTRRDITDLRRVVDETLAVRHGEIEQASELVSTEVDRFVRDRRERGAASIVTELRDALEAIRLTEWERRAKDFDDLSDDQRARVEALTKSLLAKVAHGPTTALRDAAGNDRGQRLAEATRSLFDL